MTKNAADLRKCGYNFARNLAPVCIRGIDRYVFNIQKNPMVTVAEAAEALGIDARTVREKLSSGDWKGEKRMIGMKEKWFIYRGELDRQLERLQISKPKERISTQGLESVFESDHLSDAQMIDAQTVEVQSDTPTNESVSKAIEEVLTKLTEQFSKQLHAEKEVIFSLQRELEEKDRQLRLLPDLLKQADDERKHAQLKALEVEALNKQIAALAEERQRLEEEKQQLEAKAMEAQALAGDVETLKATVAELRAPWWKKWFAPGGGAE